MLFANKLRFITKKTRILSGEWQESYRKLIDTVIQSTDFDPNITPYVQSIESQIKTFTFNKNLLVID